MKEKIQGKSYISKDNGKNILNDVQSEVDHSNELKPYHNHSGSIIWLTDEQIRLRKLHQKKKKKKKKIKVYYPLYY